jgi:tRNA (guanine37-N1)-methyltransferase
VKIDVFTLFPDWFDFFRGQRHVQNAFAGGLEFAAVSYRDTTPLTGGQVDDTPYGGGAGMVIRVDVVEAALEQRYGDDAAELRSTTLSRTSSPARRP